VILYKPHEQRRVCSLLKLALFIIEAFIESIMAKTGVAEILWPNNRLA
jgi:hypothetical protein